MDFTELYEYLKSDKVDNLVIPDEIRFVGLDDLMKKDENGVSYFEHLCNKKVKLHFTDNLFTDIMNNSNALYYCAKHDYFSFVSGVVNEDMFFEEVEPGVKLIDYLVNNRVRLSYGFLDSFRNRVEILDYVDKINPTPYSMNTQLADKLLTEENGKYLADKYISNPKIKSMIVKSSSRNLLIDYCSNTKNYDLLKYLDERSLLMKTTNRNTILEFMLDNNIDPLFPGYAFKSPLIFNILIDRNRLDLLYNANLPFLLEEYEPGKTYLDYIIENQKSGKVSHLEQINYLSYSCPSDVKAEALIKLAKNDLIGFVPTLTSSDLINKSRNDKYSILECLIELDRETTIKKIIPECRKQYDENFVIILKNLGVDEAMISINPGEKLYSDRLRDKYNKEYSTDCVSVCPELIQELSNLFKNDGKSNDKLIECLVSSYTYLTDVNHPNKEMFITELNQLIAIKKQHYDTFIYDKVIGTSNFNNTKVSMEDASIPTLNHETTHALHYFLGNYKIPDNYKEVIERVRNDETMIQRVKQYSALFNEIKDRVFKEVSETEIASFFEDYYQGDARLELSMFLSKSKDEQKKMFSADFNEQVLDTILAKTYSVDEFIAQKTNIEKRNVADTILRNSYDCLCAIGDIIDAIYEGKFRNNVLFDEKGNIIQKSYGHGIDYFSRSGTGFKEMVAEYASILKSNHSDQMIEYLRSIVGDEVVDMIKDVYENEILRSNAYVQDLEAEETANAR